jgi:cyanophycinase
VTILAPQPGRGTLMPIGGAEDKRAARRILCRFVELSGGSTARLVVIPTASVRWTATGERYRKLFLALGAETVDCLSPTDRGAANAEANVALLDQATGVFITGGDQLRLLSHIGGTAVARALRARFAAGVHVAGTSAGASALSRYMIAFGRSGEVPSQRMVQLAPGLGLVENLIIDQHFRQRNRIGRLTTAVALCPGMMGIGLDEDTALIISPSGACEVVGSGSVTIVDGRNLEHTNVYDVKRPYPINISGISNQTLGHGERYELPLYEQAAGW